MEVKEPELSNHKHCTREVYEAMETDSGIRIDFWHGKVIEMAETSLAHEELCFNMAMELRAIADKFSGSAFKGAKLEIEKDYIYVHPDAMLTCHPEDPTATYFVKHPSILVEVISDNSESYDIIVKWRHYQRIPSLRYMIFVREKEISLEVYHRVGPGVQFTYEYFTKLDETANLEEYNFQLPVSRIYNGVRLPGNKGIH